MIFPQLIKPISYVARHENFHASPRQQCLSVDSTALRRGFSILEVLAVIAILMIIGILMIPNYNRLLAHAAQAKCMANMRSIHVGLGAYLNDHQDVWPQGPNPMEGTPWADFWIKTLVDQGVPQRTWECPAIHRMLGNPPKSIITASSIHYTPTMFDETPGIARRWPTQPWLIERADAHGNGALICFTDGSIKSFNKVLAEQGVR